MQPQPAAPASSSFSPGFRRTSNTTSKPARCTRAISISASSILPGVKQIRVTYHYPTWTGLQNVVDEHGGDLRAVEGTDADLEILMDRPAAATAFWFSMTTSRFASQAARAISTRARSTWKRTATITSPPSTRASPSASPTISSSRRAKRIRRRSRIDRPGRDYRASPIEEVTVAAKAADDFGLNEFALHYSVNGGPEKTVDLLKQKGAKQADGSTALALERFQAGARRLVSVYATAKDAQSESRTDMFFIQADPFEREFSQSQQMGGGGGGGGGMGGDQNDISQREKEIIAATWKQQSDKTATAQKAADTAKFLSQCKPSCATRRFLSPAA